MFELTISKQQLLTPLLTVVGAVDKKQSLVILSNILLKLTEDHLFLTATDLEIEITSCVDIANVNGTGIVTVPAKKLIDIVRLLDDNANPTISFNSNIVTIKEGRSVFKLATLPADDYPNSNEEANEAEFSIQKAALLHLLQATHFAMSQHDARIFLNGLFVEIDAQKITAVATDGHRMAICHMPCPLNNDHHRLLIPRNGIQEILKMLSIVTDEEIQVCIGKRHFKLITKQYTFSTKLIEARFPPYNKVIPKSQDKQLIIDRDLLKRALSRIIILANEKSRAVLMHIQPQLVTLIANNQEQEEAIESLTAETTGDEIKIGINASYLLDVLNNIPDGSVRLSLAKNDSSILVESLKDENYMYIIMPMKI